MEEDQEQKEHIKHVCKFCNKNFSCGRSLGGHMRSHVTNFSAENEKMKKLSSLNNGGSECSEVGYGLRENPKKTWRLTNSTEETGLVVVLDKLCKECGRGFQSWKALFGHMKCHSDKEKVILDDDDDDDDDQDSWNKVVMNDCESNDDDDDNEVNVPPKSRRRRRRSKRKRTRYMKTTTTTSVTSSVSVSEIEHEHEHEYDYEYEQEQEEVAISLMMLSRDVSNWGGFNSIGESSETNLVSKIENKRVISNDSEIGKFVKSSDKNSCQFGNSNGKNSEILVTHDSTKNDRFGESSYQSNSSSLHLEKTVSKIEGKRVISNGTEIGKLVKSGNKKSKFFNASKKSISMKNCLNNASESGISKKSHKKGKFECTTCNKIFHSYQALGGHRASHKRNKSCFASKIESIENTNEFEESNELMKNIEYVEEHEELEAMELESQSQSERVMVEESLPEIRNFLDLNLPATTDEENNGNQHAEIYKPWWLVGNNHKQEGLVGLLSNYS